MLMHGLLLDGANRHPDRDCFHWVDRDRGFSYSEAAERMADAAGMLQELGLRPGDRLTILAHNGLDYLVAMFGAWHVGAIAALVNIRFADQLSYYFADHTPTVVVYTHDLGDEVRTAAAQCPSIRALVCMDGPQPGALSMPEMIAAHLPAPPVARNEDAVAHLAYTSGTTGKPKGACLKHEPTVRASRVIAERLRITQADISFGPTALSSSYQLVGNLLPQLSKGAAINIMGRWTPQTGLAALRSRKATMLIANPPVLTDYLEACRHSGAPATTLRMGLSGGGAVAPELKAAWARELSLPLVESFGQSELGGFMALGYPDLTVIDTTSRRIGPALPDKDVRIVSPEGVEMPVGEIGDISLTGGFMAGYWGRPDKTAEVVRDGWLLTGDIGRMDADGTITMLGRRSELLTVAGEVWYPRDIEEELCTIDAIRSAALVGVAGPDGLRPVAAVTVAGTATLDIARCNAHLARTTPYDIDRLEIVVVEDMPMTPTGKIAKAELAHSLGLETQA